MLSATPDAAAAVAAVARLSAVPTILRVITEVTGLRLSLVAHVTDDEWTCCAVNDQMQFGLSVGGTLDVATTLCSEVRSARAPIVISHASADTIYCNHRTPKRYGFESYIAVPIFLRDGTYFGNVCALDAKPLDLHKPQTVAMFELFAQLVGAQLEAEADAEITSRQLLDAHRTAELREQFIAVLGHDLRTPVQSITLGAALLAQTVKGGPEATVIARIAHSAGRIRDLVNDVLDFARGRLGSGMQLERTAIDDVGAIFARVVGELQAIHPSRTIHLRIDGSGDAHGDPTRLSQLMQNLLDNALVHSPPETSVEVTVRLTDTTVVLAVANSGPPMPPTLLERLFEPYHRGHAKGGLGLGLYIASQIVHGHGGVIEVRSDVRGTVVTCSIPRG